MKVSAYCGGPGQSGEKRAGNWIPPPGRVTVAKVLVSGISVGLLCMRIS